MRDKIYTMTFETTLVYRSGYKYQTERVFVACTEIAPPENLDTPFVTLDTSGRLVVAAGYAWDGCSWPALDDRTNMRAGLVHDALYRLMRLGLLDSGEFREAADKELARFCLLDGMPRWRAWCYYQAVRKFGATYADPKMAKPPKTIP